MIFVLYCTYSFIKAFSIICMYYEMIDSLQNWTLDGTDDCCFCFEIFVFIKTFSNGCMYLCVRFIVVWLLKFFIWVLFYWLLEANLKLWVTEWMGESLKYIDPYGSNNCIQVRYRSSLFRLFFINIKINSSPNYCLFVCLVYILFVCLFTFFIPMLSWCLTLEQSRCTQSTVNSGGPRVGGQPLLKWKGGCSNRVVMGHRWGGNG